MTLPRRPLGWLAGLWLVLPGPARAAALRVFATTADLASLASEVAGDRAKVEALSSPRQNAHFVEAKPSLIVKLMKADVLIETGLDLETGWAPLLVMQSRNARIQPGGPGRIDASEAVEPIEVPENPSRAMGDVHPGGNPHYLADPENGRLVARLLAKRLAALSPEDAPLFELNLADFEKRLDQGLKEWVETLKPHAGSRFVSYHREWSYFARRFGLASSGEIEPKPGIPPTAASTAALLGRMKREGARLIFVDPWYERRTAERLGRETGAALVPLSLMPGTLPQTKDYLDAAAYNVRAIADALKAR